MAFNVVIVGTGIAGLGAAIALTNKGHNVTVLEATSQLRPVGGIIVLQANANRVLDSFGIYDSLLTICTPHPLAQVTRSYSDGEILIRTPAENSEEEYGYPLWSLHRADLQRILHEAAMKRGINLKLGCQVLSVIEAKQTVIAVLKGGERIEADLIVGADGISSVVRKNIVQDQICVHDSGMDTVRASIPADIVRSDPETSFLMEEIGMWFGPLTSLTMMPVRRGDELLLGLDCCRRRDMDIYRRYDGKQKQDINIFKEYFKGFTRPIQKLLLHVEEAYVWNMQETKPSSWVGPSGRTVLIGDAAHSTLPWVGQGGGLALEDAATLAQCLGRAKTLDDLPHVLQAFQDIRQPRCKRVQEWSARKGYLATLPDGPEQKKRDQTFRVFNAWANSDTWDGVHVNEIPEVQASNWRPWLVGHDTCSVADKELDRRFGPKGTSSLQVTHM